MQAGRQRRRPRRGSEFGLCGLGWVYQELRPACCVVFYDVLHALVVVGI